VRGYILAHWDQPHKLPPSFAALGAFCFGVFGAIMGMAQKWFTGPAGKAVGGVFGGDIGFELAFAFTFVSYLPMRYFEKRLVGR
jgi:purine-cytosine permease-like protein